MTTLYDDFVEGVDVDGDLQSEAGAIGSGEDKAINHEARKKIESYLESKSFENQLTDQDYLDRYYDFADFDDFNDAEDQYESA